MTTSGTIQRGAVVLDSPTTLPDGTKVEISITSENPTQYDHMKPFIGIFDGLPPDASAQVDHYLYGVPKR